MADVFGLVAERSGGQCDAMVRVGKVYARCGVSPIQIHHKLLRSRGGDVLDAVGETHHLMALCRQHHDWAHAHPQKAVQGGLIIEGQVWLGGDGVPVYVGTDPVLLASYERI